MLKSSHLKNILSRNIIKICIGNAKIKNMDLSIFGTDPPDHPPKYCHFYILKGSLSIFQKWINPYIFYLFFEPFPYTDSLFYSTLIGGVLLVLSSVNSKLWFKEQFWIQKTTIDDLLQYFVIICQIFFYANSNCGYDKPPLWNFLNI